jgi:predicted GIY-YIG superfamily endonuclease
MNDKVVYLHRRKLDNKVFYVGIGNKKRPYDFSNRNNFWNNYVKKYGKPFVEIYKNNLTKEDACKIEIDLIKKYGRRCNGSGHLVNLSIGGEIGFKGSNDKRVICLKKGVVYNSITEYCQDTKKNQPDISKFLNRDKFIKRFHNLKDYNVRLVINNKIKWIPYFDGNFIRKDNTYQIDINKNYNINNCEIIKQSIQEKLYKITDVDIALLYLSYNKNLSKFCKEYNLPYFKLYNRVQKIKIKLTNKNITQYNKPLPIETKELILKEYYNSKTLLRI